MANLIVSSVCPLRCPYCFTADAWAPDPARPAFLSLEAYDARLDFLDRSGIDEVRLLGGEPTLHPDFPELLRRARARGKRLTVFTNGLVPVPALAALAALDPAACTVLVNVNAPAVDGPIRHRRRLATLARLGERAQVGFTIYRADADMGFLLDAIEQTGCRRTIRVGLAQPCLSGTNAALRPARYPEVGRRLAAFAAVAARAGVTLSFDCGFVPCMFTPDEHAVLAASGADAAWRCGPILDIDVTGAVVHCYPLASFARLPLVNVAEAAGLREALDEETRPFRASGIFPGCSACEYRDRGVCAGGCLAATMRRFWHPDFVVRAPPVASGR